MVDYAAGAVQGGGNAFEYGEMEGGLQAAQIKMGGVVQCADELVRGVRDAKVGRRLSGSPIHNRSALLIRHFQFPVWR